MTGEDVDGVEMPSLHCRTITVSGEASWFCDGCLARFDSPQPDRSQCVQQWVVDIKEQVRSQFNIKKGSNILDIVSRLMIRIQT